ncbi:MAG: GNAT family N-acetyltransferase, partial [Nitrospinae bacterium]|nr:GNAT family N-acetyltransferase [Nitrospinota bacterium]
MSEFIIAETKEDYREAGTLLREYEADLGIDLCFQGFPEELESLERMYGPPGGRFLLLRVEEETAGCVALVDSGGKPCEMKRLYVRPGFRGRGLGRKCAEEIVRAAKEMGYAS